MSVLQKWENKIGNKLGNKIPNLMIILIILQAAGTLITMLFPDFLGYIAFIPDLIFQGQVWRLLSFLMFPNGSGSGISSLFMTALMCFIYFSISRSLEMVIGRFKLNFFLLSGILIEILCGFLYYFIMKSVPSLNAYVGYTMLLEPSFLYSMMFVLFAMIYPDARFLLLFFIPVKGKWLVFITLGMDLFLVIQGFLTSSAGYGWILVTMIVAAILTVLLFLALSRGKNQTVYNTKYAEKIRKARQQQAERRNASGNNAKQAPYMNASGARHCCTVCKRTERTNPELEFRYCSKCVGNYEYCSEHLYTHLHKLPNITDGPTET